MSRLLVVTPEVPWPLDQGGRARTFHLFTKGLRDLGHTVDAVVGVQSGQLRHEEVLQQFWSRVHFVTHPGGSMRAGMRVLRSSLTRVPYAQLKYTSTAMHRAVRSVCLHGSYDLVILEHEHAAAMAVDCNSVPIFLDLQNVYSDLYNRTAISAGWSVKGLHSRIQAHLSEAFEQRAAALIDGYAATSDVDLRSFARASGTQAPGWVVANGVDVAFFAAAGPAWESNASSSRADGIVIMTGSMDYYPNADGASYLVREVMPLVWQRLPRTSVLIVGRQPGPAVVRLGADPRVLVTGTVPDVRPYLRAATVAVVPLRSGSGTRLKALEAAAAGIPIVGSSIGLEGLRLGHENSAWVADDAVSFANGIVALLLDTDRRRAMADAALECVRRYYAWTTSVAALGEALEVTLQKGRHRPARS